MKRKTKKCEKCEKAISLSNFKRHSKVCKGEVKTKYPWNDWKIADNLYKHPSGFEGNMAQVKLHINRLNGVGQNNLKVYNEKVKNGELTVWNKGKTVESHPHLKDSLRAGGLKVVELVEEGLMTFSLTDYVQSEKGRQEQSERKKRLYEEFPEKHPNRKLAGNRNKMTYPERIVFDALTERNILFEHNKKIGKYYPDFLIKDVIIEIDGERWHNSEKDTERDKKLNQMGYTVKRFPVGIKKDLVKRVLNFVDTIT